MQEEIKSLEESLSSVFVPKKDLFYPSLSPKLLSCGFTLVGVLDLLPKVLLDELLEASITPETTSTMWPVFLIEFQEQKKEIKSRITQLREYLPDHKIITIIENYDSHCNTVAISIGSTLPDEELISFNLSKGTTPCVTGVAEVACSRYSDNEDSFLQLNSCFFHLANRNARRNYIASLYLKICSCKEVKNCYLFEDLSTKRIVEIASQEVEKWRKTMEYIQTQDKISELREKQRKENS